MRHRGAWSATAAVIVAAVAAASLGAVLYLRNPPQRGPSGSLTRVQLIRLTSRVACPNPRPSGVGTRPPRAFTAVAAVLCESWRRHGAVLVIRRATASAVPALQRAVLNAGPPHPTAQCFVSLLAAPGLVLIDHAGRQLDVPFPRDACGLPDLVIRTALERRPWIRLAG
jgi:hypothetical protein